MSRINSLFIICIGIIRNNSLVGGRARAEARTSATECITLYCTWHLSALTIRPHGQVEGVGQFECKFSVVRDVARNPSMGRYIEEWYGYHFGNGSLHTKKLCSILLSTEVVFLLGKTAVSHFVPPFGRLRGNVHYTIHLCLVGKRVIDFLSVLIELFHQLSWLRCYEHERILVKIMEFERGL